ncbi:8-oxo-dGTP diphosphatase [Arthrobacter sp. UYCu723]
MARRMRHLKSDLCNVRGASGIPGNQEGGCLHSPLSGHRPRLGDVTGLIDVVGGAVLDSLADPGRLLVARRTAPPQFAGLWEFPGGKVESGETAEQALHRELLEELGVNVRLGAELQAASASGWPLNDRAAMRVWFAELVDGDPHPLQDHDELRWIDLGNRREVLALPWIPADLPIVEALLDALQDSVRTALPAH